MIEGRIVGVFGTDSTLKGKFEASIAKKSEVEGMIVFHRNEAGVRYYFLDDTQFPEKIQGYARLASISDYAYYVYPASGRLTTPDGELAILLDSFGLSGVVMLLDGTVPVQSVAITFKGLGLAEYETEARSTNSSYADFSKVKKSATLPAQDRTLIYVDRAFSVKGVGTVVLGFVISGTVRIHDELRAIPSAPQKMVEVKGIQVNDEDQESVGRGVRVGLSLKGVEARELDKVSWLDDGSYPIQDVLNVKYAPNPFYRQEVVGRDLHIQLPGELVVARIEKGAVAGLRVSLQHQTPVWDGMRIALIDLNGKNLRVAGGGTVQV